MLISDLRGLGRAALAAAVMGLSVGTPACVPPPEPAEMPPQPGPGPAGPQAPQGDDGQQPQAEPQQDPQAQQPQQGEDDANVEDFYEPLANYGTWVETPQYGKVWQPADDVAGETFVPYASDGQWAANDDGDWVFQSRYENEWGWATYHYGRWVEHEDYGWVWVPGTTWAPSWVEWRYGNGYVGWVPMGPPGVVVVESRWFFVEERSFGLPGVYAYRLPPERARVAYVSAAPIVEVRGRARWTAGPPVARLRANGVVVASVHMRAPVRGYVRGQARVSRTAAGSRAGRPPSQARVRHRAERAEHHAEKAEHRAEKAEHRAEKAEHRAEKAEHRAEKAEHHEAPKPKAAPPKRGKKR